MQYQTEQCTIAYHELLQQASNDVTFIPNMITTGNKMGVWLKFCNKTNVPMGGVTMLAKGKSS
jgi:hypothetical protein